MCLLTTLLLKHFKILPTDVLVVVCSFVFAARCQTYKTVGHSNAYGNRGQLQLGPSGRSWPLHALQRVGPYAEEHTSNIEAFNQEGGQLKEQGAKVYLASGRSYKRVFGVAGHPGGCHAKALVIDDVVASGRIATNVRGLMHHWYRVPLDR